MTCIIVDDEKHCIGTLEILMSKFFPDIHIVATCQNGEEGIAAIDRHQPDIVFLDISMPKMNGFEMLSKIESPLFKVIFTTAYDRYAIKAFKVSAVDYLLKPIDASELKAAVEKAKGQIIKTKTRNPSTPDFVKEQLHLFLENIHSHVQVFPNVAIPTLEGMEMIRADSIYYVESDGNYSKCYQENGQYILVTRTLKEMERTLKKNNFVRTHRSYLINLNHLSKYVRGDGGYVVMTNGKNIDVSRRRKDAFIEILNRR